MKKTKKFIAIKILCFALSGLLLSSSVFMSHQKTITVKASDEGVILSQVVYFIGSLVGVILTGPNVIAITNLLGSGIVLGDSIWDYVTDNGDGTYTIDSQLFQEVLNAMNDVESSMFSDDDVVNFFSGESVTYEGTIYTQYLEPSNNNTYTDIYTFSVPEKYPICAVLYDGSSVRHSINLYKLSDSGLSSYSVSCRRQYYIGGSLYSDKTTSTFNFSLYDDYDVHEYDYSFNFPIFSNVDDAQAYLTDGTGYNKALNYTDSELFEYSSRYTGVYNGGNVTISATKLDGIESKLDELNATEKSTDEKVDEIVDWLYDDDDGGGGTTDDDDDGGGDTDDDEDDDDEDGWLSALLKGLSAIGDAVLSILGKLMEYIGKAIELITDTITKVIDIIPENFTNLLTALFPFLPQELIVGFELLVCLAIVLVIVKAFK